MFKLGIIGYPLGHSLSPAMHNAALKELGIEGSYVILETPAERLPEQIDFLKKENFRGFNVTIPYKVEIMPFLDTIDDFAKTVGAVNTVVIDENKKLHGYNTDVFGFVNAIEKDLRETLVGKRAAILGSGGAARAIIAGLIEIGITEINIFAIEQEESLRLKENILKNFPDFSISCFELNKDIDLKKFSIVVNATPLGMQGKNEGISALSEKSLSTIENNAVIYDIVYKPQKTKLIELAEKRGLKTVYGLEMLLLQGVKGFELWTNQKAPINLMREALIKVI